MEKALTALAAAAAIAAAAAVGVVSAAFALFALVEPLAGPAGAGAIVAGVAALVVALAGLMARQKAAHHHPHRAASGGDPDASLVQKVVELAKERPMLAAGAALAAGVYAIRHPALIAAVVGAIMENRSRKD